MVRGRKKKVNDYFGPEEEQAVADFLNQGIMIQDVTDPRMEKHPERVNMIWSGTTDHAFQRELIYNRKLREPLNKMVEYIIKRYKLYREGISFDELHMDALNNLILKAHKFDADRNKKAYSYYGTIIKRYLIAKLIEDDKYLEMDVPFYFSTKSLRDLKNRGFDLVLLTARQYPVKVQQQLDNFNWSCLFSDILVTEQMYSKKELLIKSNYHEQSIMMIGDTGYDIKTANDLNIFSVGVLTGFHSSETLRKYSPKKIVDSIEEIQYLC